MDTTAYMNRTNQLLVMEDKIPILDVSDKSVLTHNYHTYND